MIELTKDYIENLKSIIEAKDDAKAQEVLHELYPADIAELYQELNLQEAIYLYLLMDGDKAADVLMELDEEDRHKLLKELPNELIAKRFVDNMETDDAVDLMRELDEDTQEEILSHIEDVEQAGDIVDLLKYDEDTPAFDGYRDDCGERELEYAQMYRRDAQASGGDERDLLCICSGRRRALERRAPLAETDYPPIRLQDQACHEKRPDLRSRQRQYRGGYGDDREIRLGSLARSR